MLRRRRLLGTLLAVPVVTLIPGSARAEHYMAMLCGDCSFGSKRDECAKCGKWRGSTAIPARLCGDHGFGSKRDNCARCGKWIGSTKAKALLCGDCGFGSKKENCVVCDKWAP